MGQPVGVFVVAEGFESAIAGVYWTAARARQAVEGLAYTGQGFEVLQEELVGSEHTVFVVADDRCSTVSAHTSAAGAQQSVEGLAYSGSDLPYQVFPETVED